MKSEILEARIAYWESHHKTPTMLFVSPEAHTTLCQIVTAQWLNKTFKSLVGSKVYGMWVHLVPTLESGFYVA